MYDHRPDRVEPLAGKYRATPYSEDLGEMFAKERLDVVSVCTPPWLHAPQTLAALAAGIHVLVEKPMAMTEAECRGMCDAAIRRGLKLCVDHNFLFARPITAMRRRIEGGRSGRIEATFGFQMSTPRRRLPEWYDRLPGQLFFDEAPHLVYLTRRFLGGTTEPDLAYASAVESLEESVQRTQNVVSVLQSPTGLGVLMMTFNASRSEWAFGVVGSRESYVVDLFRDQLLVMGQGGRHSPTEVLVQTLDGLAQMGFGALASGAQFATRHFLSGHETIVSLFLDAIERDLPPPVPGQEGLQTISLLESICREAKLRPITRA